MEKDTRNAIERATQRARKLLEEDFAAQLEGDFDVHRDGAVAAKAGGHLSARQACQRERIVAAIEHKRAGGMSAADAARDYLRDAAFTTINRFVALKMLEARDLVQECITKGEQSAGYREFCGMAPGLPLLAESAGYRLYIESLFDELSTEVKVLFDRRDPSSVLWPKRATFEQLLEILNATDLARVWGEDETIGWVYQFFNGQDERRKMRDESPAPRNSRELAVRNQFFTPRYVVQFLTDNTLGRIWYEMRSTTTVLAERCDYMVRKPDEDFAPRAKKDPRDLRVLDPACGSGHFLLYAFDLLLAIYEEAWSDPESPKSEATGETLSKDYPSLDALRKAVPRLVLAHNLHGVDIDPRCAQIAQLALWMRAQKAYRDFGLGRADRAQIRRSNIVVAEPLVVDEQIAAEFVAKLGDAELGRVFTSLVESLSLAGDLGLLLRVETLVKDMRKQGELFAAPEDRIRAALDRFVREEASATNARRRLFADDAAHGVALLRIAEKKFDAVLMNPPFGDPPAAVRRYLRAAFPAGRNDVFAAFVLRAAELRAAGGLIGALTTRAFFTGRDNRDFRKWAFASPTEGISIILDLGEGVLDQAGVETAAYVVAKPCSCDVVVLDARNLEKPFHYSQLTRQLWHSVERSVLASTTGAELLYELSRSEWEQLAERDPLDPTLARVTFGITTKDNFRFVRLRWEVEPSSIGPSGAWTLYSKGGEYGWLTDDVHLVVNRRDGGRELAAVAEKADGNVASTRRSSTFFFRPALTFSRRSQKGFSARRLRRDVCFSDAGGIIAPLSNESEWATVLLVVLMSVEYQRLVEAHSTYGHYEVGAVKGLPSPPPAWRALAGGVSSIIAKLDSVDSRDETKLGFSGPAENGWRARDVTSAVLEATDRALRTVGLELDPQVREHQMSVAGALDSRLSIDGGWRSFLLGMVFGRWRDEIARPDVASGPEELFEAKGSLAPAERGASDVREYLVDDEGAREDIVALMSAAAVSYAAKMPTGAAQLLADKVGLREWLRKDCFSEHVALYSRSSRAAPLYWQLATSSAAYSIWLYARAVRGDTLYRISDEIERKLGHEARRLDSLRGELRGGGTAEQRKSLVAQDAFVEELHAFFGEVKRVAPLWRPNLDDGVIINFAPLWRLVPQNKSWQKELKSTWDALCEGKYDWAHLAMHLWPERVVPKCARDRSLAIAHELEDVFWVEGTDGKWTARKAPTRSVDELVRERTSPAVKSALKSLLEAPASAGKSGGRRGGGRRKPAAAAEGGEA